MSTTVTAPVAEAVWHELHDRLRRFIARRVRSPQDAEDILHEVILRIHRHSGDLEHADRVASWVYIEEIPLPDGSVDVVISNCVINLAANKRKVLAEVARVLRPGGRFAVSDVIADPDMDAATRADMQQWTGCISGALTREEFERSLADVRLTDIEVHETHRVHEHASSAIVRARKPEPS
jgi:SAM-dependent methyltransferase